MTAEYPNQRLSAHGLRTPIGRAVRIGRQEDSWPRLCPPEFVGNFYNLRSILLDSIEFNL